jgi:hypothetical protein
MSAWANKPTCQHGTQELHSIYVEINILSRIKQLSSTYNTLDTW